MPRWEHGSKERLKTAALELFAERARVATRTFFRYFSDKREVLFADAEALHAALVEGVLQARNAAEPLQLVTDVLAQFDWETLGSREFQRQRHAVIAANPDLLERSLIKHHSIAVGFIEALQKRGVEADIARLAATVGIDVFFTAYRQWLAAGETSDLPAFSRRMMSRLATIVPRGTAK
jgi:AcrR family transcriptional regulator